MKIIGTCLYYDMLDNTSRVAFRDYVKAQIKKVGAKWNWKDKCWRIPLRLVDPLQRIIDEFESQFLDLDEYTEEDFEREVLKES